jgi:hypothetical protein
LKKKKKKMGRPKSPPKPQEMLKEVIPIDDIFDENEKKIYYSLVDIYLNDFDKDDLTSSDMDDIMSLATNKVLEIRLLRSSKGSADKQLDISNAIEKLRKQTEKIKDNLSSRRKDRINPHEHKGFSIVDLAVAYDQQKKERFAERVKKNKEEENEILVEYKKFEGNKNDVDVKIKDGNEGL